MQSRDDGNSGLIFFKIGMAIITAPVWLGLFLLMLPELLLEAVVLVGHYLLMAVLSCFAVVAGALFNIAISMRDWFRRLMQLSDRER
jgi:hypothetical protein